MQEFEGSYGSYSGPELSNDRTNIRTPLIYQLSADGQTVNVSPSEYMMALEIEAKKADVEAKQSIAAREKATAFQLQANAFLGGLAEVRCALGFPQVDEEKEREVTALKNVFDSQEKDVLKKKYIHFLQLFHKHLSQLYPQHHSAYDNAKDNQGS